MKSFVIALSFFVVPSAHALVSKTSGNLNSALNILNLPSENRRMVIREQGDKNYSYFISVAFNEEQTMNLRWRALMAAMEARGERSVPDLIKASASKEWYMRNASLVALSEIRSQESEKIAIKLLKDKALVVRSAAVHVLENSLSKEVREALWTELDQSYNFKNSQSLWIRHQIVELLAKKPNDSELRTFVKLLSDEDERLHIPAVRGLEKLTGIALGTDQSKKNRVSLWRDYIKKGQLAL